MKLNQPKIILYAAMVMAIASSCTEPEKEEFPTLNDQLVISAYRNGYMTAMISAQKNVKTTLKTDIVSENIITTWQVYNENQFKVDSLEFTKLLQK